MIRPFPRRRQRLALAVITAVLVAGLSSAAPAVSLHPEASAGCTIPTLDDRCEASVSALRGVTFPVAMVASGSRVYSMVTGWRLRAADAETGAAIWDRELVPPGPGTFVTALAAAPDGSALYAAGTIESRSTVVRVSPVDGTVVWSSTEDLNASGGRLAVTPDGSRVVLTTNDPGGGRIVSMGLDSATGAELWQGASDLPGSEFAFGHALSPDGSSVYAIANTFDPESGAFAGLVVAFDVAGSRPSGSQLWATPIGNGTFDVIYDGVVSADGATVYAVGSSDKADGTTSGSVTALHADDGAFDWGTEFRGSNGFNEAVAIAQAPAGDRIYIAGTQSTTAKTDELDAVILALNSANGRQIWRLPYGPPGLDDERFFDVAVSPDGSKVFATGTSGVSNGVGGTSARVGDALTVGASQDGTQLWAARYHDSANADARDAGRSVVVSGNGRTVHVLAALATSRFSADVPQLTSFRNEVGFLSYTA